MPGYEIPGTFVLKNKLGAKSNEILDEKQADLTAHRQAEIHIGRGPRGNFDANLIKALHGYIFQDVFEWAGHTRNEKFKLSDGTIVSEPSIRKVGGDPFAHASRIRSKLALLSKQISEKNCLMNLPRKEFAKQAAFLFGDLNSIHPFREGNGRTQRAFFRLIAEQAGHKLNFSGITHHRMAVASAMANAHNDHSYLIRMFDEITDPQRCALLLQGIKKLKPAYGEQIADRYITTFSPGETRTVVFAGTAGNQFMARTNQEIFFGLAENLPSPPPKQGQEFTHHEPDSHGTTEQTRSADHSTTQKRRNLKRGGKGGIGD